MVFCILSATYCTRPSSSCHHAQAASCRPHPPLHSQGPWPSCPPPAESSLLFRDRSRLFNDLFLWGSPATTRAASPPSRCGPYEVVFVVCAPGFLSGEAPASRSLRPSSRPICSPSPIPTPDPGPSPIPHPPCRDPLVRPHVHLPVVLPRGRGVGSQTFKRQLVCASVSCCGVTK